MVPVVSAPEAPPTTHLHRPLLKNDERLGTERSTLAAVDERIPREECEVTFDLVRGAACALTSRLGVACEPGTDCKHGTGQLLAATRDPNVKQTAQHESRDWKIKSGGSIWVLMGDADGPRQELDDVSGLMLHCVKNKRVQGYRACFPPFVCFSHRAVQVFFLQARPK